MEYEILPLPKEEWKGTVVPIRYTSSEYYDLEIFTGASACTISISKKKFGSPVTHTPEEYDFPDRLYQDHWENARAWGIVSGDAGMKELLACVETCPEDWNNRLTVTELWVSEPLRRRGIGRRLMDIAKKQAKDEGRRAVILETQSCNVNAIEFYRSQGFRLIGFDSCCYSNTDMQRKEVRLDMGYFPDEVQDGREPPRPLV